MKHEMILMRLILFVFFVVMQFFSLRYEFYPLLWATNKISDLFYISFFFHLIFSILWIWAYIMTSWIDSGSLKYELTKLGYFDGSLLNQLPEQFESLPRCPKCNLPKPIRCHHCSECDACMFRFDHHCPAIGNCVALKNMKSFMLFNFYTSIIFFTHSITGIIVVILKKTNSSDIILTLSIIGGLMGLGLTSFGCNYIPQILTNRTTLENIANIDTQHFDEGNELNWKQIFGESIFSWFIPTWPTISGFRWSGMNDLPHFSGLK